MIGAQVLVQVRLVPLLSGFNGSVLKGVGESDCSSVCGCVCRWVCVFECVLLLES